MKETTIRALKLHGSVWINAGDFLTNLDNSIAEYRRIAATYKHGSILKTKFVAFADAIQAERDDLASTIEGES